MSNPTVTPMFTPQAYAPIFCAINGEAQSFVKQIDIDFDSNATDVSTIMRQWSGVVQGSARIDFTLHAVVPYAPTDSTGTGLGAIGATAAGIELINTMVTTINQVGNTPVSFAFGVGGLGGNGLPNTQVLALGFIKKAALTYSDSGVPMIVYTGSAQFTAFD
jgi:hypothetical protein